MSFYDEISAAARPKQQIVDEAARQEIERQDLLGDTIARGTIKLIKTDLIKAAKNEGTEIVNGIPTVSCVTIIPDEKRDLLNIDKKEFDIVTPEKDPFPEIRYPGKEKIVRRGIRSHIKRLTVSIKNDRVFSIFDRTLRQLAAEEEIQIHYCLCHRDSILKTDKIVELPYTIDNFIGGYWAFMLAVRSTYRIKPR